jgi:hypothetical protein
VAIAVRLERLFAPIVCAKWFEWLNRFARVAVVLMQGEFYAKNAGIPLST